MKNRYAVDRHNRLIIKKGDKTLNPRGNFSVDKDNRLFYWLNEPSPWRREQGLPKKIAFRGNWQLTPDYGLEFLLHKAREQSDCDRLSLKGTIISPDKDELVFQIISRNSQIHSQIRLLKLSGFWQADEKNRLSFVVKKEITPDILTLQGSWQLNKNQQIIYSFEKNTLQTKKKAQEAIVFSGFWKISGKNRLAYCLEKGEDSAFDFRAHLETPNLYPSDKVIKYRVGIGLKRSRGYDEKVIPLYGEWKFSRRLGVAFQMDYGNGGFRSLGLESGFALNQRDKIIINFTGEDGKPLGINITLAHKFLKMPGAEGFLRLQGPSEKKIETGIRIPF
ncbi:MAG: hypothetical protein AB1481_02215 [Candidatus Omnitrophota bacterium]